MAVVCMLPDCHDSGDVKHVSSDCHLLHIAERQNAETNHETNYMYSDHTMVSTGVITLRLCMCVILHVTQRQHGHVVV